MTVGLSAPCSVPCQQVLYPDWRPSKHPRVLSKADQGALDEAEGKVPPPRSEKVASCGRDCLVLDESVSVNYGVIYEIENYCHCVNITK